jgi:hypothetical protein
MENLIKHVATVPPTTISNPGTLKNMFAWPPKTIVEIINPTTILKVNYSMP